MKKYFFTEFLSVDFGQKVCEEKKIAMKKFLKNLSFEADLKL